MSTPEIIVSDVVCSDCGGAVTLFSVPDKVWSFLGLGKEFMCMACVAVRILNTEKCSCTPSERDELNQGLRQAAFEEQKEVLSSVIYSLRKKFKLRENGKKFCGVMMKGCWLVTATPGEGIGQSMTADEVMRR